MVEGQALKSLTVPWVRTENWVVVMETESRVTIVDKVTEGTVNSCNRLEKAREIERLEKVKGEGHFHVVKEY